GPSAASHLPGGDGFGVRLRNPPLKGWLAGEPPEVDVLTADDVVLERLMTGLRTLEGVDLAAVEAASGVAVEASAERWLADCLSHGLLALEGRRLRATPAGVARLDAVLRAFVATRAPSGGAARTSATTARQASARGRRDAAPARAFRAGPLPADLGAQPHQHRAPGEAQLTRHHQLPDGGVVALGERLAADERLDGQLR